VKYVYPAVIQLIVYYFKWVSYTIKTDKQAFIFITFYRKVISGSTERPMNIGFGNPMVESDNTVGWNTPFGLGLEAVVYSEVYPNASYLGVGTLVSFSPGPVYFELDLYIPGDVEAEGITLTPEFEYYLFDFTIYMSVEFAGIGIPDGTTVIKPTLGFKYSF